MSDTPSSGRFLDIAVIGMSLRFPGAESVDEFWQNLCNGVESTTFFSDDQLAAAGTQPETLANPDFVKAHPILRNIEEFDAAFFGFKPREAEAIDPQMRLFLECAWEALENGGYDAERIAGPVVGLRRQQPQQLLHPPRAARPAPDRHAGQRVRHGQLQREGRARDARLLQAEPARAEHDGADVLLDVARRDPPRAARA